MRAPRALPGGRLDAQDDTFIPFRALNCVMRRLLLLLGLASFTWTVVLLISGGVTIPIGSRQVSSRSPVNPLIAALVCWAAALARVRAQDLRREAIAFMRLLPRLPLILAASAAAIAVATALIWGTFAASGADSYGYVSQAALWAHGRLSVQQPFVRDFPWPLADWTFTPLGYRPGLARATLVPTYAPGLPLVMAVFQLIGGPSAVFLVAPAAAAATVWLTFWLGRHLGGVWAGALAAVLLATSPTFEFQAIWPMSDIPAAMWWTASVALAFSEGRRLTLLALLSGVIAALALLTRPNLILVAIAVGGYYFRTARRDRRAGRLLAFSAGALPGLIAIGVLHTIWYGSPLKSGYGELEEIYTWSNAPQNLGHYPVTFVTIEQSFVAVAVMAAVLWIVERVHGRTFLTDARASVDPAKPWALRALIAAVCLSYLFYVPYPEWWYLRFFLPAYPALFCLVAVAATRMVRVSPPFPRVAAVIAITLIAGTWGLWQVRDVGTHAIKNAERRYRDVGRFIDRELPRNAIFLSVQESGSIRYYSGRLTLRYDWLERRWLDPALAILREQGFHPYIALEQDEHDQFRERFRGHSVLAELDWPPVAARLQPVQVRIYDPADRDRFLQGLPVHTAVIEAAR
ncbi:MAG: glycosyltransferase family 39 protein [Acidobacteria bacterium]|nr:glycosyltransferase family 39 protein [Acidobacteriota bacterium]